MSRNLSDQNTDAFLVVRHGVIAHEWYAEAPSAETLLPIASAAKPVVGGLALVTVLDEGLISLDAPAAKVIRSWRGDSLRGRITIRQLGNHSSGLEDAEEGGRPHESLPGWKGRFWDFESNPVAIALTEVRVIL